MHAQRTIQQEELLAQMAWVRRLAEAMVSDPHAAADVVQETWLVAQAKAVGRRWSPARLRAWLSAVARRSARAERRGQARRAAREERAARPEEQPSAYEIVARSAQQKDVVEAVLALAEPYRSTILYRYLDELPTAEVAERMGTSTDACRQRLARGRRLLREELERTWPGGASTGLAALLAARVPDASTAAAASSAVPVALGAAAVAVVGGVAWLGSPSAERPRALDTVGAPQPSARPLAAVGPPTAPSTGGPVVRRVAGDGAPGEGPADRVAGSRSVEVVYGEGGAVLELDVEEEVIREEEVVETEHPPR